VGDGELAVKPALASMDGDGQRRVVDAQPSVRVLHGDMRQVLATLPPESVDAVVTDPPYGLEFMAKGWDREVPGPDYWREVLRVCRPGAHLLACGGTRTAHRLACAIEDAGWEVRDCLSWLYGSGFPKSHDVSKAIDREAGAVREVVGMRQAPGMARTNVEQGAQQRSKFEFPRYSTEAATDVAQQWHGWGTALKPAWEPIYLARKPFKGTVAGNVLEHGCGALNVDGCRITGGKPIRGAHNGNNGLFGMGSGYAFPGESQEGRWPANLVLDEDAARMLDAQTGDKLRGAGQARNGSANPRPKVHEESSYNVPCSTGNMHRFGDSGGASRFFYTAKASRAEREAGLERIETPSGCAERRNMHPTVKPVSLVRWLVRLITPPGGLVLDPFLGSGTTGVAAMLEGARFIGVELSEEYAQLALARIEHAADEDDEQLCLFERSELRPPVKVQAVQTGFVWGDEAER
jgi:DNA modification methylase